MSSRHTWFTQPLLFLHDISRDIFHSLQYVRFTLAHLVVTARASSLKAHLFDYWFNSFLGFFSCEIGKWSFFRSTNRVGEIQAWIWAGKRRVLFPGSAGEVWGAGRSWKRVSDVDGCPERALQKEKGTLLYCLSLSSFRRLSFSFFYLYSFYPWICSLMFNTATPQLFISSLHTYRRYNISYIIC